MSENKEKQSTSFNLLPKIINGGIAGIIAVTSVFPLDLVKTRLQNQSIGPNGERLYTSILDCFRKIYKTEGFFGLYRGIAVNIILITPEKALKLSANDFGRHHLQTPDKKLSIPRQMIAGAFAGIFEITVITPMELIKIRMQDAGRAIAEAKGTNQPIVKRTTMQVIVDSFKDKGIFGIYKGLLPTIYRDITFSIIYFPLMATLNDIGPRKNDESGEAVFWWSFLSGLLAGATAAFTVTPMDVIKTRLQADEKKTKYKGFLDTFWKTYTNEGPLAFFKGGACRVMVIAPLFGIVQAIYFFGVAEYLLGIKQVKSI